MKNIIIRGLKDVLKAVLLKVKVVGYRSVANYYDDPLILVRQ